MPPNFKSFAITASLSFRYAALQLRGTEHVPSKQYPGSLFWDMHAVPYGTNIPSSLQHDMTSDGLHKPHAAGQRCVIMYTLASSLHIPKIASASQVNLSAALGSFNHAVSELSSAHAAGLLVVPTRPT